MEIRDQILAADPDVELEQRWKGGYGEVLMWNAPTSVCSIASRLHNRRQHNSQTSSFYDLIRKFAQMAAEVQTERASRRLVDSIATGDHVIGVSPPQSVDPAEAMLSPDQVHQAYLDSGYLDNTPTSQSPGGTTRSARSLVCPTLLTLAQFSFRCVRDVAYSCVHIPPLSR